MLISKYLIPLAAASSEISITTLLGQIFQCLDTWGWHGADMGLAWKSENRLEKIHLKVEEATCSIAGRSSWRASKHTWTMKLYKVKRS